MLLTILAQNVMIGSVSPPIPSDPFIQIGDDDGGGYTEKHYDKEKKQREEKERKIRIDDSEIIAIVELTLKHFTI